MSYMIVAQYNLNQNTIQRCSMLSIAKAVIAKYAAEQDGAVVTPDGEQVSWINAGGFRRSIFIRRIGRKAVQA